MTTKIYEKYICAFCKRLIFVFTTILLMFLFNNALSLSSVIYPQRTGSDGRFKSWLYHNNGIYYFEGYYMNPTYIEFSNNEKINTMYTPNKTAWSIKAIKNKLFLTPVKENAETTLTVMTNLRTYFFELHARTPNGALDPDITFYVKFRYPSNKSSNNSGANDGSIIQYTTNTGPDLSKVENFNFNYTVSGDYVITPIKIFDDGRFTYFEFKDVVPAIFSVDSNGYESVVNFRVVNQYIAVENINSIFTLRHGQDTVCVFNETLRGLTRNLTKSSK